MGPESIAVHICTSSCWTKLQGNVRHGKLLACHVPSCLWQYDTLALHMKINICRAPACYHQHTRGAVQVEAASLLLFCSTSPETMSHLQSGGTTSHPHHAWAFLPTWVAIGWWTCESWSKILSSFIASISNQSYGPAKPADMHAMTLCAHSRQHL